MQVSKKVLIFDSGVGGLSVYREIHAQLPHYNYVYLFDNQGYPYGELDAAVLIERVSQLVGRKVWKSPQVAGLVMTRCGGCELCAACCVLERSPAHTNVERRAEFCLMARHSCITARSRLGFITRTVGNQNAKSYLN